MLTTCGRSAFGLFILLLKKSWSPQDSESCVQKKKDWVKSGETGYWKGLNPHENFLEKNRPAKLYFDFLHILPLFGHILQKSFLKLLSISFQP